MLGNLVGCYTSLWRFNPDGVNKELLAQLLDLCRHRRREQHCLPILWQFTHNFLDWLKKAKIKHVISFIKDQMRYARWVKGALVHQVNQTTRCCDDNIYPPAQPFDLGVIARPAKHGDVADVHVASEAAQIG